jgi:hypothetical protein
MESITASYTHSRGFRQPVFDHVRGSFFLVQQLLPALGEGPNIVVISSFGSGVVVGKPGLENPSILCLRRYQRSAQDSGQELGRDSHVELYED